MTARLPDGRVLTLTGPTAPASITVDLDFSRPTMKVPAVAKALGCSAWELYRLIQRDESPVPVIRLGRNIVCPTAAVRRLLQIDEQPES